MRVLDVYSGNLWGGIEAHLVRSSSCGHLAPGMWRGFALCFESRLARELRAVGAPVFKLPPIRIRSPRSVIAARDALAQIVHDQRIDVLLTHAPWSHALFGPVARRCGVKLVTHCHDLPNAASWLDQWASRVQPDLVLCNSEYTKSVGRWMYRGVERVVTYSPMPATAPPQPETRARLRARFGAGPADVVILFAARLEAYKGHELLFRALSELRAHPGWTCWIAGGPQRRSEEGYEDRLLRTIERLELGGRVTFLGQIHDVPELMTAADIHCQSNVRPEPFGLVFIEALSAGLPIVTTDMGSAREIVTRSCGRRTAPDPRSVAAALRELIDDPDERARLSRQGPARALELCDPETRIPELAGRLSALLR